MNNVKQETSIKPSIVNDKPGEDVRIEMEVDAQEIIDQYGHVSRRPSLVQNVLEWSQVAGYTTIAVLILVNVYYQHLYMQYTEQLLTR